MRQVVALLTSPGNAMIRFPFGFMFRGVWAGLAWVVRVGRVVIP